MACRWSPVETARITELEMAKPVAGFIPCRKGNQNNRSRAEQEFNLIKRNKHDLSDKEKAKQADREKTARLKELCLAKEAIEKGSS